MFSIKQGELEQVRRFSGGLGEDEILIFISQQKGSYFEYQAGGKEEEKKKKEREKKEGKEGKKRREL